MSCTTERDCSDYRLLAEDTRGRKPAPIFDSENRRRQIFVDVGDEQSRPGRPVTDTHSWASTRCRRRQIRYYGDVRQRAAACPVGPLHDRRGARSTLLQSI